ncbi:MAG: DUF2817 domain-containing protein [Proteobacteria bacterium]|nr:DUF2817 domain-containing protein [Pseudomonadota bacterium]MBI3497003.1 DUF2817 domain-containing protein [Pseudomonadota bacterium]
MAFEFQFSATYWEARDKFLCAAKAAGATIGHHLNPNTGPGGEEVSTDTAWLGPEDAPKVLVVLSATHGVEGFCGSGCQIDGLISGGYGRRQKDMAVLLVHGVNCHGFAWLRRTTEENVDLNRNWVDYAEALPANPGYDELAQALVPPSLSGPAFETAENTIQAWREKHGDMAYYAAVGQGQYKHKTGLFYGGEAPTWARRTSEAIIQQHLGRAKHVAAIDLHTGLGPYGYGEPICDHPPGSDGTARAKAWFGESVTEPALGTSSSTVKVGLTPHGWTRLLPHAAFTYVALEYGTFPRTFVRKALREDAWLHAHSNFHAPDAKRIKAQIRRAFFPDTDDWKEMVLFRAAQITRQAIAGLAAS